MMKHTRPDTDYKISQKVDEYFERYQEVNKKVEMLAEKIDNASLSTDDIDTIHQELDENISELERLTTILEGHGYIRL